MHQATVSIPDFTPSPLPDADRPKTARSLSGVGWFLALAILCGLCAPASAAENRFSVLVYSFTPAWAHPSIPTAVAAIKDLGAKNHFNVVASNDPGIFSSSGLSKYAAVIFLDTMGNSVPEPEQRLALEGFIRAGGGFLGIHSASDTNDTPDDWPWYRKMVGAIFKGHTTVHLWADEDPNDPYFTWEGALALAPGDAEHDGGWAWTTWETAHVHVEDTASPAMRGWGPEVVRADEWYGFVVNPRPNVHVLATVDEATYDTHNGDMGPGSADHPIAWCHDYDGGRAIYTAMGHAAASWSEPLFLSHIEGAIEMAAGATDFDCATGDG